MAAKKDALTKPSEPEKVDAYMAKLAHPLADVVAALRKIILSTDREIGEEIKWNAPAFFIRVNCRRSILRNTNGTLLYSTFTSRTAFGWSSPAEQE